MSRIQDILAKAERDGTARRLQASSGTMSASAAVLTPNFDSTATLGVHPFATPMAPPAATPVDARAAEPRTARATLHPALVAAIAPHSEAAEQFRAVRTKLTLREELGPLRAIGITS